MRDPGWATAYLLLFGAGTIIGMMLITLALAAPFAFSWTTLPRFNRQLRVASGLISFGFRPAADLRDRIRRWRAVHRHAELAAALTTRARLTHLESDISAELLPATQRVFSFDRLPDKSLIMQQLQNRLVEGRIQSIRLPHAGALLLAGVIVVLMAVVGYALQREFARQPAGDGPGPSAGRVPARALSADEEVYAAALWPIHREVKLAALGMSFAGIAYKTDGQDANRLEAEVRPLAQGFSAAIAKARALEVPASMREVHERYLGALASYENAADEMVQAARDGREQHLIEAQGMSFHAAEDALRVGDVLWPGEYKPH